MRMTDITWQLNYAPNMTNYSNENIFAKYHLKNHHKSFNFLLIELSSARSVTIVTLCFTHDFLLRIIITQIWLLLLYMMWMHFQFSITCDEISNYPKKYYFEPNMWALLETHLYGLRWNFCILYFEHSHWDITLALKFASRNL